MAKVTNKFNPSSVEIYARGEAIRWMQEMGWPMPVIDSIMMDDCPELEVVRTLVYLHGPDGAFCRIRDFLE